MPKIIMTRELARCVGIDAGNRSMRVGLRTSWNEEDYNAAVQAEREAYPLCVDFPGIPAAECGCLTCQGKV